MYLISGYFLYFPFFLFGQSFYTPYKYLQKDTIEVIISSLEVTQEEKKCVRKVWVNCVIDSADVPKEMSLIYPIKITNHTQDTLRIDTKPSTGGSSMKYIAELLPNQAKIANFHQTLRKAKMTSYINIQLYNKRTGEYYKSILIDLYIHFGYRKDE